jgi:nicotinamide-nucleotide amidase
VSDAGRRGALAILSVGDEVLSGRVTDTNAALLARELEALGWRIRSRAVVGDEEGEIAAAIAAAFADTEVVVLGGGLGPTADDLTRYGLARAFGVGLVESAEAWSLVRAKLRRGSEAPSSIDRLQALLPEGARPLANPVGTAPGILIEDSRGLAAALPGVPRELAAMLPALGQVLSGRRPGLPRVVRESLGVAGLPEAEVGRRLADLMARDRAVRIGSYPQEAWVRLVAEARHADEAVALASVRETLAEVARRFGRHALVPEALDPADALERILARRGLRIAVAESLTGGAVAARLVAVPGASSVLAGAVVAYTEEAKLRLLGVRTATLRDAGAVSAECALEMAEGARRAFHAGVGLATTGIAGPSGATPFLPLGIVHFGWAGPPGPTSESRRLRGERESIRTQAAVLALDFARRRLEEAGDAASGTPIAPPGLEPGISGPKPDVLPITPQGRPDPSTDGDGARQRPGLA